MAETLDPQAAYAMWAPTYPPRPHNQLMAVEQQAVLSLLPDLTGMTVLDAGCGTGRYLRELRARGAEPIGVDLSSAMLARAREITPHIARANIVRAADRLDVVDVDRVRAVLGDVAHLELALANCRGVLRPGGCVVYSVVHPVGAGAGWSRTFDAGGRQVAINSYLAYRGRAPARVCRAGLRVTAWQEPVLREAPDHPALLVVRASR